MAINSKKLLVSAVTATFLPMASLAGPVTFNAGGIETVSGITVFDWGPSNVLALNGNQAFVDFINSGGNYSNCGSTSTACLFTVYAQGTLSAFLDKDNQAISSGLGTKYEITYEISFGEGVFGGSSGVNPTTGTITNTANFFFNDKAPSYFKIYFDTTIDSNALAGTGYTDGSLVMQGTVAPNDPVNFVSNFSATQTATPVAIGGKDEITPSPEWTGYKTVSGAGSTSTLDVLSLVTDFVDPNFFKTAVTSFLLENVSQALPFTTVNPSLKFREGYADTVGELITQNLVGTCTSKVNGGTSVTTNGLVACGSSIIFQSDPNSPVSGEVPEPASLALLGIGLAGLGVTGRRRRKA